MMKRFLILAAAILAASTVSLADKRVTVDGCENCLKTAVSELEDLGFTPEVEA